MAQRRCQGLEELHRQNRSGGDVRSLGGCEKISAGLLTWSGPTGMEGCSIFLQLGGAKPLKKTNSCTQKETKLLEII